MNYKMRWRPTDSMKKYLQACFEDSPYLAGGRKGKISGDLKISETEVVNWFANRSVLILYSERLS